MESSNLSLTNYYFIMRKRKRKRLLTADKRSLVSAQQMTFNQRFRSFVRNALILPDFDKILFGTVRGF